MGTVAGGRQVSVAVILAAQDLLFIACQRQAEVAAFLQDLVRVPSVNGRADEAAVAQRVAA